MNAELALSGQAADAADNDDVETFNSTFKQIDGARQRVDGAAQGFGFKVCGHER